MPKVNNPYINETYSDAMKALGGALYGDPAAAADLEYKNALADQSRFGVDQKRALQEAYLSALNPETGSIELGGDIAAKLAAYSDNPALLNADPNIDDTTRSLIHLMGGKAIGTGDTFSINDRDNMIARNAMLKGKGKGSGGSLSIDPETNEIIFSGNADEGGLDQRAKIARDNAALVGVPYQPQNYTGIDETLAQKNILKTADEARKKLDDPDERQRALKARDLLSELNLFDSEAAKQDTGGMYGLPMVTEVASWFDPEVASIEAITSRLTPAQRVEGSGSTSNYDAAQFKFGLMGMAKPKAANKVISKALRVKANNELQRQAFLSDYVDVNGSLAGADKYWQDYLEANPIFSPTVDGQPTDNPKLNPSRKTYKEYFSGAIQQPDTSGRDVLRERALNAIKNGAPRDVVIDRYVQKSGKSWQD